MLCADSLPQNQEQCVRLAIASQLHAVPLLVTIARALGEHAGLTASDSDLVALCVAEAANNAILHAYRGRRDGTVTLEIAVCADKLTLDVIDTGDSADPKIMNSDRRAVLNQPTGIAELPESGRGVAIIQGVMDSVEYSILPGCNRLRMVKKLNAHK